MRRHSTPIVITVRLAIVAASIAVGSTFIPAAHAQQTPAPAAAPAQTPNQTAGRAPIPLDPRVQIRTHHFAETNEDVPYALFVSSKVRRDHKAPMIVTLHGLGGTHTTMMRANAIDLAEAGGYILVAPMGYNPRGWYGIPAGPPRRGGAASPGATSSGTPATRPAFPPSAQPQPNDPPNLRELSEKETLEVVDLVRKEFVVDDSRTYLMGHSMGGAGTYYLAIKYPERWAAIGVEAPAAFALDPNALAKIPNMPIMVVHGDMDTLVPVSLSRTWVDVMKSLKMSYEYVEIPGGDHGSVINQGAAPIFAFFAQHSKTR